MHIVPQPFLYGYETNYGHFLEAFPSETERYNLALDLAGPGSTSKLHTSQLQIGAHWGHNPSRSTELARFIYGLGIGMNENTDQPVMVVTEGSLEDVLSDEERLQGDFAATFAMLPENIKDCKLGHFFRGRMVGKANVPFLLTSVMLDVRTAFEVEGDEYTSGVDETEDSGICVYKAAIPLDGEFYNSHLRATDYTVVYGLQSFLTIAEALQRKGFEPIEERLGLSLDQKQKITGKHAIAMPPIKTPPLDIPQPLVEVTD